MYTLESNNNRYIVSNFKRKDNKYNVYVVKESKLSNNYLGESVYCIGVKEQINDLTINEVLNLTYHI